MRKVLITWKNSSFSIIEGEGDFTQILEDLYKVKRWKDVVEHWEYLTMDSLEPSLKVSASSGWEEISQETLTEGEVVTYHHQTLPLLKRVLIQDDEVTATHVTTR